MTQQKGSFNIIKTTEYKELNGNSRVEKYN